MFEPDGSFGGHWKVVRCHSDREVSVDDAMEQLARAMQWHRVLGEAIENGKRLLREAGALDPKEDS